jgi:hypothetical protein
VARATGNLISETGRALNQHVDAMDNFRCKAIDVMGR